MSQKALNVVAELYASAVTCPGVHLPAKDDICLNEPVKVELMQLFPLVGEVLAVYEGDARSFLFPEPKLVPSFSGGDREVLMTRDPTFPGISPRLEFITRTKISECTECVLFQHVPLKVSTRKKTKSSRHQGCFSASHDLGTTEMPRSRSLALTRKPGSNGKKSKTLNTYLAYDNSSDTDELHDNTKEPLLCNRLSGHEGSTSSVALSHTKMACPKLHSFFLYSPNSWEEVQERVRSLVTIPQAVYRLAYGATKSERDEVLERRSVS